MEHLFHTKLFLWTMVQRMIHGIRLKQYQKKMSILLEFIFQEILEKNQRFLQDLLMLMATVVQLWIVIYSIHLRF